MTGSKGQTSIHDTFDCLEDQIKIIFTYAELYYGRSPYLFHISAVSSYLVDQLQWSSRQLAHRGQNIVFIWERLVNLHVNTYKMGLKITSIHPMLHM